MTVKKRFYVDKNDAKSKKSFYGMQMNISQILFGQNILEFRGGVGLKVPHRNIFYCFVTKCFIFQKISIVFHRQFEQLRVYFRTVVKES